MIASFKIVESDADSIIFPNVNVDDPEGSLEDSVIINVVDVSTGIISFPF